ncbi:MAG: nicotinate (nicotinamide) nucleotide adenylyltransferase [Leptospiraceae bacterium]|nr:nicotinate (nicotinamide) nucleotide adenylyltransferase [Leptospiraceae bacterium]
MIGIFGGSFDPPHEGHLNIVLSFWENYPLAEKLIIIPNKLSPFKKRKSANPENIIEMWNILLGKKGITKTEISDIEIKSSETNFTISTILKLKKIEKNQDFYLLIGMDNLQSFPFWKDYTRILENVNLLVFRRPGYTEEIPLEVSEFKSKIHFLHNHYIDISSSDVRKNLEKNKNLIPKEIINYISEKGLYDFSKPN